MTTHIMTDIETLGTRPGAIVLAAAFVRFSDEQSTTINLSIADQEALGLEKDPETLAWWQDQEAKHPGAWAAATQNAVPLVQGLQFINSWVAWAAQDNDPLYWCHGATFDCPLLQELYRRAGVECPWGGRYNYGRVRDTRTLYDLAGINPKDYAVPPPHIALNDALGQTRAAKAALAILARAHGQQGVRRYFHHPESGCVFSTYDGSTPGTDGLVEEITGAEYIDLAQRYGVAA